MQKHPEFANVVASPIKERLLPGTPPDLIDLIEKLLQYAP